MGADLIVVSRNATPPVFKLGEAAKALFEQRKKEKELKKRQLEARRAQAVKEVIPVLNLQKLSSLPLFHPSFNRGPASRNIDNLPPPPMGAPPLSVAATA